MATWWFMVRNNYLGVSKNSGGFPPKMDGENNGKSYEKMDDLGGKHPYSWKHPYILYI